MSENPLEQGFAKSFLQGMGSGVAIKMDEPPHPRHSSLPTRNSSISPTKSINDQDGQELTRGHSLARGNPTSGVSGESCGAASGASCRKAASPEMPAMVAFYDDEVDGDEVEQGRPAHTRKPPVGMTQAE